MPTPGTVHISPPMTSCPACLPCVKSASTPLTSCALSLHSSDGLRGYSDQSWMSTS